MSLSAFDDPGRAPDPDELGAVLGPARDLWPALIDDVRRIAPDLSESWKHSGAAYGWSLRLLRGSRTLVYLTPQTGRFLAGVALGEKAIAAAEAAGAVSDRTRAILDAAPRYAEGRGIRYEIATADHLGVARELARIKLGV
jgi:hypothetical protein